MSTFVFSRAVALTVTLALVAACAESPDHPRTVGRGTAIGLAAGIATGAVRDQLVARGVPAGQLATVGRGSLEPRADNATPEGRAANRRVEMVLTQPA